jgi:hypothetical protein
MKHGSSGHTLGLSKMVAVVGARITALCLHIGNQKTSHGGLERIRMKIKDEMLISSLREQVAASDVKNKQYMRLVRKLERERDASIQFGIKNVVNITPLKSGGKSEATAVVLCSDWHIEETVKGSTVSGLNEYNIDIAKLRADQFWRITARMVHIYKRDIPIPTIVLWLGGDFISGNIHDELLETCSLQPVDAAIVVQGWIASGITYLLEHTDCNLIIPCSCGNHSRITRDRRIATETGNSLELFIYHALANHFKHEKRVRFLLPQGYHTYVGIYGKQLRFHHGHGIKYGGGIGGIFIPAFKAIGSWNKGRVADQDIFGHYHSAKDGGSFLLNGSLIGYNAYALSIKADFETPRQMFFLMDSIRGKTLTCPIIV